MKKTLALDPDFPAQAMVERLGKRLQMEREKRRWSQADAARQLGVAKQTVSAWERGTSPPTLINMIVYARALGLAPAELFGSTTDHKDLEQAKKTLQTTIVPIYSWDDAISVLSGENRRQYQVVKNVASPIVSSDDTIATRITDSSMMPRFAEGDLIVVDPRKTHNPGDFVVANAAGSSIFRRFRQAPPSGIVEPLNSMWASQPLQPDDKVLATMTTHMTSGRHY